MPETRVEMARIDVSTFSLKHTFESAQPLTFYADYSEASNTITYPFKGSVINIMHTGGAEKGALTVLGRDREKAVAEVKKRFRLDDDLPKIYKRIGTDLHIKRAIASYRGMRLTLNDPWETTLTFIISQFNNVKRIRLITKKIVERYGATVFDSAGKPIAKEFPESRALAGAAEKDLQSLGSGFRAKYIRDAAEYCTNNLDLYKLPAAKYDKLKESLMSINGVGEKVADCIILMGYGNLKAFPIDVHVKREMEKLYFKGRKKKLREIQEFAERKWANSRGYAQQYLFHNARLGGG
ncbi:hypothetical protein M1397_02490 [Candidatus Marsarchaeota archaeon]|nr:hypothetical protein [Candidatus Marsarchaeota archaeon]